MSFDEEYYQTTLKIMASHGCSASISPLGFITEGVTCRGRCCIDDVGKWCEKPCDDSVGLNRQLGVLHKMRAKHLASQPDFTGPLNVCFNVDDYIKIVQKIWLKQDSTCQHDFRDSEKYDYDCNLCHVNVFCYRKDEYTYNYEDGLYYSFKQDLLTKPEVSRLNDPNYVRNKDSVKCTKCSFEICKICHLLSNFVDEATEAVQYYKTLIPSLREKYHILEEVTNEEIVEAMVKHNGNEESAIKEVPCETEEYINYKKIGYKAANDYWDTLIKFEQLFPAILKHKGNVQDALYEVATKYNWVQYYNKLVKCYRRDMKIRASVPNYLILYVILKGVEKRDVDAELKKLPVYNEEEAYYIDKMPQLIKNYCYTNNKSWSNRAEALIKNKGNLYYTAVDLYRDNDWESVHRYQVIYHCEKYGVKLTDVKEEKELYPKIWAAHGNYDIIMREYMSLEEMMTYHKNKIADYREEYSIKETVTDEMILELIEKNNGDHHKALRDVPKNDDISETNIPLNQPINEDHEWCDFIANLPNDFKDRAFRFFYDSNMKELKEKYKVENATLDDIWDVYISSFIDRVPLEEALGSLANGEKKENPRGENALSIIQKLKEKYPEMILYWNEKNFYAAAQMCPDDEDMIISLVYTLFE
jgi:hypothetical protein